MADHIGFIGLGNVGGLFILTPGLPAEIVDDEPEEAGYEVGANT